MLGQDENQDFSDDSLSPARRKQQTDDSTDQDVTPDELSGMEEAASSDGGEGKKADVEEDEDEAVSQRLQDFYSEDGKSRVRGGLFKKGSRSRKLGVVGAAVGIPSLLAGIAFLPGLLGLFKIQNFYENVNASSFLRLNAAFENRSDKWLKAYIKLRLTEIDNDEFGKKDTLFFRAGRVDTDNPIRDWYQTMRTSRFEKDLLEKEGISFTNSYTKDSDGRLTFGFATVNIKGHPVEFDLRDGTTINLGNPTSIADSLNKMNLELDTKIDAEIISGPGSSKKARRIIKDAVDRNTNKWRVFQRRHIRKSIANMTGVRSWRLFETSRDKLDAKKKALFDKIMVAVLPSNRIGVFVACLFGAGNCPSTTDPNSSDSKATPIPGDGTTVADDGTTSDTDADGNPKDPDGLPSSKAADDIAGAVTPGKNIGKQIREYIGKFLGNPYTKVWTYLKKIAHIHDVLSNNKLGKLVVQGRRAQYMAAYASMAIAISQMKSGDISGTEGLGTAPEQATGFSGFAETITNTVAQSRDGEVNEYMRYFDNAERSEAWMLFGGGISNSSSVVSAEGEDPGRAAYCDMTEANQKLQPVYYLCGDEGIGSGSRADNISEDYNNSVGKLLGPIADAVEAVRDSPLGTIFDFVSSAADKIIDKIVGPALEWVLETTGSKSTIEDIVTTGVVKAMEYVGAGVKYDPNFAGQMNFMMMGGAATSESSARNNGAALTSSMVGLKEYSNKMALDWKRDNEQNLSTFEKYASLSNPKSLASTSLMALSTSTPGALLNSAINPAQGLDNYASVLGGRAFASNEVDSHSVAEWSGLDTYDFPQQCIDLNPLEPGYFISATNAPAGVTRDMATLGDTEVFWKAVYDNLPGAQSEKEEQAASIYNCALLDRSVRGGIGYAYGYTDDGGYPDTEGTASDESLAFANVNSLNCDGYDRISSYPAVIVDGVPTNTRQVPYNEAIRTACAARKAECLAGVSGGQKALCAAFEFGDVYYGSPSLDKSALEKYGFKVETDALYNPKEWFEKRQPGLNPYNTLACSSLTTAAVYVAFNYTNVIGCSSTWTQRSHPDLFKTITANEIAPGDFITRTPRCVAADPNDPNDIPSHIAIAASPVDASGNLVVYHSAAHGTNVHFQKVNISFFLDPGGTISRWIGPGL